MRYSGIEICSVENGLGVRISLFVTGCPFHCKKCFNQSTWSFDKGNELTQDKFIKLKQYLQLHYIAGLSLLGGDPTSQDKQGLSQLIELCEYTHSLNKNVWIWSGYTWEELFPDTELTPIQIKRQELIKNCDVLVDGRYIDEQRDLTLKWRGSKNQRVIDIQKSLKENKVILFED